jgi:hypothetical protein
MKLRLQSPRAGPPPRRRAADRCPRQAERQMTTARLRVVEDDRDLTHALQLELAHAGYDVRRTQRSCASFRSGEAIPSRRCTRARRELPAIAGRFQRDGGLARVRFAQSYVDGPGSRLAARRRFTHRRRDPRLRVLVSLSVRRPRARRHGRVVWDARDRGRGARRAAHERGGTSSLYAALDITAASSPAPARAAESSGRSSSAAGPPRGGTQANTAASKA